MSLLQDLFEVPSSLSAASKYTVANGIFYFVSGALFTIWPEQVQVIFREPTFIGREGDLARVTGMLLGVIGWLCIFGGRTGGRQFVAATVVDRILIVPLVLVPLVVRGVFPHVFLTFAILDPALAIGAWLILDKTRSVR